MKLIIDSGATKTQWSLMTGKEAQHFYTRGLNPYYMTVETIHQTLLRELPEELLREPVKEIFFYGTGCSTKQNCNSIQSVLQHFFSQASITVHHDLYGAALALLHDQPGIACILGTGSNSCLWDGHQIIENAPSLGYMLGDEGSGTYLGKLLLKMILSEKADPKLSDAFFTFTRMNFAEILHKIYKEENPNRWIASLAEFAANHKKHPDIQEIIKKNFNDFIYEQVSRYTGFDKQDLSFTGSVAWFYQDELREVLEENHLISGIIMKDPMEGLIRWHSDKI
ncbi:MAG: ATPase [Bacteroidales bacterium]|nr:ATPase [Bacteroidales bacterium]